MDVDENYRWLGIIPRDAEMDAVGISDFFAGQNVFITGGTGFMGKVLIEKLLRSCPDINNIYILVRNKKGKETMERFKNIFDIPLFDKLKMENPKALSKVVAVHGDVAEIGLGLSKDDRDLLQEKINVVFHVAASVRFDDSLKYAVLMNVRGTKETIDLALGMKNIKVFAHVSTAYCNCDRFEVEERLYPPHADWKKMIMIAEKADDYELAILSNKILDTLPNTYVFAKSLAEHAVWDLCNGKVPTIIFRPSIVISSYTEPMPGWVESFNGPGGLLTGVGKGVIRSALSDPDIPQDYIPVDITIKALVTAAWLMANKHEPIPTMDVYNCCAGDLENLIVTMGQIKKRYLEHRIPMSSKILWYPGCVLTTNYYLYYSIVILFHLLPALIYDSVQRAMGKPAQLFKIQKKIFVVNSALSYFALNTWKFENRAFLKLDDQILEKDRAAWGFYLEDMDFDVGLMSSIFGGRKYLLKEDISKLEDDIRNFRRMYWIDKATRLMVAVLLVHWIAKLFFTEF